jgi:universal stress protein A
MLHPVLAHDLTVLHVIEPILQYSGAGYMMGGIDIEGLEDELKQQAVVKLNDFANRCGAKCCVEVGHSVSAIVDKADELKADLIVIGSHGKHGLGLLLGSTASGVMHHAKCDVVVVRLQN